MLNKLSHGSNVTVQRVHQTISVCVYLLVQGGSRTVLSLKVTNVLVEQMWTGLSRLLFGFFCSSDAGACYYSAWYLATAHTLQVDASIPLVLCCASICKVPLYFPLKNACVLTTILL